jgi:hypothetical protein
VSPSLDEAHDEPVTTVLSGWRARRARTGATLLAAAVFAITCALTATPGTARATTAYRYWAYYIGHGATWGYSSRGPAGEYPVDGEVQGWRFAVQADLAGGLLPRAAPTFATLCASKPARPGQLRVGVVLDFGTATDAPAHETPPAGVLPGCVYVPEGASGADVLQAAASVRIGTGADAALVCGIDNYPKTECAAVVSGPISTTGPAPARTVATAASPTTSPSRTPSPSAVAAAAAVAAVATAPTTRAAVSTPPATGTSTSASGPASPVEAGSVTAGQAAPSTLDELRSSTHHRQHLPASALIGAAVIVLLGGGALWRARAGRS